MNQLRCLYLLISMLLFVSSPTQQEAATPMGNRIATLPPSYPPSMYYLKSLQPKNGNESSTSSSLPIELAANLPSPLPKWPQGHGFATGTLDLGGLQVTQITTFSKIWAAYQGGSNNLGITIFEPSPIPEGFFSLGCYSQPNNAPLFGSVLVAKDNGHSAPALKAPVDYTLTWSSQSLDIKQDSPAYIWLPTPPAGYNPVGYLVTASPAKPPLDAIRCVRSDLTDPCEADEWMWGSDSDGIHISSTIPADRGVHAMGVAVGTFTITRQQPAALSCLKNTKPNSLSAMPNLAQVEALIQAYSPAVYFHPDEEFLPSTVSWYFTNGALLHTRGNESSRPVPIDASGSNLPRGGTNDGSYWIDLPVDGGAKDRVKKGDLQTASAYFHIKPMLGGTFTDVAVWLFYPFNGAARAKVGLINHLSLGRIGEHVGDWEHVTLRVSNFDGGLKRVYFSEHNRGQWVDAWALQFHDASSKPVVYSSLHGHASYPKAGTVMHGSDFIGIRDDCDRGNNVMDTGLRHQLISGDYLGIVEPPWVDYMREWGPKITYDVDQEMGKIAKFLPGKLRRGLVNLIKSLPPQVLGEEGPTGPKVKSNWEGDEILV